MAAERLDILIFEHDQRVRDYVAVALKLSGLTGHEITEADSVESARELIHKKPVHTVLVGDDHLRVFRDGKMVIRPLEERLEASCDVLAEAREVERGLVVVNFASDADLLERFAANRSLRFDASPGREHIPALTEVLGELVTQKLWA